MDASEEQKEIMQKIPSAIRMLQTVRGEIPGNSLIAYKGEEYRAIVNQHGAVSAVVGPCKALGLRPHEYEVTSVQVTDGAST